MEKTKKRAELAFQIKNWILLMGRFEARTKFVTIRETMSDLKIINKVLFGGMECRHFSPKKNWEAEVSASQIIFFPREWRQMMSFSAVQVASTRQKRNTEKKDKHSIFAMSTTLLSLTSLQGRKDRCILKVFDDATTYGFPYHFSYLIFPLLVPKFEIGTPA